MKARRRLVPSRKAVGAEPAAPGPKLAIPSRLPAAVVAVGGLALLAFQLLVHHTPFYGVETDLLGDLIPAARALRAGHIDAAHFEFKGPGYPVLLAAAGALVGDDWMGARVLNVIGAALGAWFVYRVASRFLGPASGLFVLCGLFLNPVWVLAGVEAGTDMPSFALSMCATDMVLRARRPRSWGAAGFVAASAILTRYNAVSLVPAALVTLIVAMRGRSLPVAEPRDDFPRERTWRTALSGLAPYMVGLALPLAAWALAGWIATGAALQSRNYLNVAFQIYGRGGTWDEFWLDAGLRFHSLFDVLAFDPRRVAVLLGRNAALRWIDDLRQLVPVWIGVPALLGMLFVWPRRRGVIPIGAHFAFAYLVLTTVFYNTRFFLYLVPFYLMGAAALIFEVPIARPGGTGKSRTGGRAIPVALRVAVATILLLGSGVVMWARVRAQLAHEPLEVRVAAETLRRIAPHGGRIMARKPHVAYFAGMDLVPLPQVDTFMDLFTAARATRADYLFYSGIEADLRSQFWLLEVKGIQLPGLEVIESRVLAPYQYYTLYRFTSGVSDTAALLQGLSWNVAAIARAYPNDMRAQAQLGALLLRMGQPSQAIPHLTVVAQRDPGNLQVLGWRARAYFEVGDDGNAARDCERISAAPRSPASSHRLLGLIRVAQGRLPEARVSWQRAIERDPTGPELYFELAAVEQALDHPQAAREAFDKCATLAPDRAAERRERLSTIAPGSSPRDVFLLLRTSASMGLSRP